ncbi:MAG: hypothetical protein AVDCRST_MAG67-3509, partial [uncultured Solirubrobacteraceae bacterium]
GVAGGWNHLLRLSEDGRVRRAYQRGHGVLLRLDEPIPQHPQRPARNAGQRRLARERGHRPRRAPPDRGRRRRVLVDDRLRRAHAPAHHARQGARPVHVRHLGRDPRDHPARGRDPRRRRRDLHGRGRVCLRGAVRTAQGGSRSDRCQELLVQAARRQRHQEPLPAADERRADGVAALPAVRRGRDDLRDRPGLRPDERPALHRQRRPELHDAVVDRVPVSLHVLRQHEVHRKRREVQAHPPPQRALHRRRGQDRARALPAPQPRLVSRRQLHGDPVPRDRGVRRAVEGGARPAVRRLRRDPQLRQARQVRAADVGRDEPRADGHPERQPPHAGLLQASLPAGEDPRRRRGQRVVCAEVPHPAGLRHHHRQPDRDGRRHQGDAAAALRHAAALHALHLLAEGDPEHRAREGDEGARRRHRGDLGDVHGDPAAPEQPAALCPDDVAPAGVAVEAVAQARQGEHRGSADVSAPGPLAARDVPLAPRAEPPGQARLLGDPGADRLLLLAAGPDRHVAQAHDAPAAAPAAAREGDRARAARSEDRGV